MSSEPLPQTDSIKELARFWEVHDLTDFEDQLEETGESVFIRETPITLQLQNDEAEAVRALAKLKGLADTELIREWVLEKIHAG